MNVLEPIRRRLGNEVHTAKTNLFIWLLNIFLQAAFRQEVVINSVIKMISLHDLSFNNGWHFIARIIAGRYNQLPDCFLPKAKKKKEKKKRKKRMKEKEREREKEKRENRKDI